MHTKYCCNILHLISLPNLDQESDVDDSVLEIPAFGSSPDNDVSIVQSSVTSCEKDVLHVESFCLSSIGVQRNQASNEYDNYVAIIDDEFSRDDEDPEFIQAIEESLAEATQRKNASLEDEGDPVQSILRSFQRENIDYTESEMNANITISRKAIFATARMVIERKRFSFLKPVFVTFAGEDAVDEGGPKREFFRLLMRAISESSIFHGSWFSHDLGLLADKRYELCGKLIAWSILHGGSGPRCLSGVGYDVHRGFQVNHKVAIESVADHEMKEILDEAVNCSTEETFSAFVKKYSEKIAQYGYPKVYVCSLLDKDEMVESLLKQCFVYSVHTEISQFFQGLNSIGNLGDMIIGNKLLFDTILNNQHPRLTKAVFMSLCEYNRSEEGSNKREEEDKTIYSFEVFLQDLEEGEVPCLSLEDLLVFITAADCVPPLGFDKLVTIDFYDFDGNVRRRPHVSTCGLYFFLPRGFENPTAFSNFMKEALLDCHGFGKG